MNYVPSQNMVLTDKLREQFGSGLADSDSLRADFTMDQPYHRYTEEDHAIWRELYQRQMKTLPNRACQEFMDGLEELDLSKGMPNFTEVNTKLKRLTGWEIVAVPGLVPDPVFFDHLANKRFPCSWWVRTREQLDYLQEPDAFHDIFGHVPLLANPVFANYMQAYGQGGLRACELGVLPNLARLYWFTVEFGLIKTAKGLRIYGAGIVSSKGESIFCLESQSPHRVKFNLERIMRTKYRIDTFQNTYFVIDSFEQLFQETQVDFAEIYQRVKGASEFESTEIYEADQVLTKGDQSFYQAGIQI
jgi:phenylalanine-4-hydroxylase